jgi:hypothetical protein
MMFGRLRTRSHSFVPMTGARQRAGDSTELGKIKAARCGAVGGRKSAGTSGSPHDVRQRTTAFDLLQVLGPQRPGTHREYLNYGARR